MSEDTHENNISHLLNNETLKWIFVSGKGGVGKTTTSCSLAIRMASVRDSVLIVSTDPAHNISDAFSQKFISTPTLVNGFENLYAMEIDPTTQSIQLPEDSVIKRGSGSENLMNLGKEALGDMFDAFPGIDEAMSFAQVIDLVQKENFSLVIFDTAPTGHTLRLITFPFVIERTLNRLLNIKNQFIGMFNQVAQLLGMDVTSLNKFIEKVEGFLPIIKSVSVRLKNQDETNFICVCIAEFLSLYETERLIQYLFDLDIEVNTIFVNQLIPLTDNCNFCSSRRALQSKYLNNIKALYEDFSIIQTPMLEREVRGPANLKYFANLFG